MHSELRKFIVLLTFPSNADLIPTANSLSAPPNQPTGPAYIPRSKISGMSQFSICKLLHLPTALFYFRNKLDIQ